MLRHATRLLFVGLAAPLVGCMSLGGNSQLLPDITGGRGTYKESDLPTAKTVEVASKLAVDMEQNGFLPDAAMQYERVRKLDPSKKQVSRRLAVIYDKLGEENKAGTEYAEALKLFPKDANLLNDYGYFHYNRGRWADAEQQFRKALAINEQHAHARINLGLALAQQGKIEDAFNTFVKVNRPAEAKANLAFVLAAQGKKDEAMQSYRDALAMEPGLKSAQQGLNALENPPMPEQPKPKVDRNVQQAALKRLEGGCFNGSCPTPDAKVDDGPLILGPKRD